MQQNNNKTCIISYGPYCDLIYQNIKDKPVDLINAIFINKYSEVNLKKIFAQYDKVIVYERIFNNNTLASDLYSYAYEHNHNTKIISMSYRDYPGFGSLQKIDEIAKMTIKDILHNL
jgi:deoxyxylulose-5-phosphate synthase